MRLRVTNVRQPKLEDKHGNSTGEVDYKGMPVVEFIGSSHSLHSAWDPNANSMIRGMRGISQPVSTHLPHPSATITT